MTIMHITRSVAALTPRVVASDDIAPVTPNLRLVGRKPKLTLITGGERSWGAGKK